MQNIIYRIYNDRGIKSRQKKIQILQKKSFNKNVAQ
jgi:hypothetical protein